MTSSVNTSKLSQLVNQTIIDLDKSEEVDQVPGVEDLILEIVNSLNIGAYEVEILQLELNEQLLDFDLFSNESELELFSITLSRRLKDNLIFGEVPVEEEDKGSCELCEREMPLTFHHLIPRETHSHLAKKGTFTKDDMRTRGTNICRPCHTHLHRTYDNLELAINYNTVEKLLESEKVCKFIEYISKQKIRSRVRGAVPLRYSK
ncbi:hypothetical protein CONCODRAFT_79537 [Conidiobolus coronatus NRRL 28638]|uniref:HNH domain-containing protein n=1 Tax=Conidiobolus coronatus (strain ATCC 28846 / CBS 209.66 / NRRL 28638) TaxID=796925 RepID=A0A137P1V4_CONC2|nr:hypothetical protein CONCODRAFT_79537 [Conidiobolus coronatus NRRL 28638]|eukprot:KXN68992.1 hypothetical protein CONCODRAFT_79537 [Conidiobolus coronatus NRRL 28638]